VAVYTEISDQDLAGFVADYDIGSVLSCSGLAEGIENSNYLLTTDRARYVLTLFERRVTADDLPYFLGLMAHLAELGLPCPIPIAARDGAVLRTLSDRPAVIVSFLDGAWPREPTPDHCAELGNALARLHMAGQSFAMTRPNDMGPASWRQLFNQCVDRDDAVTSRITDALETIERQWPKDLPSGVIHADLFPDNVFFQDDKLTGVLDFYFACNDFLAFDLAIAINGWCFDHDNKFDAARSRRLISAYQDVRPLTGAECDALPILCRGAALRFLLTRLYDQLFPVAGLVLTPKDPMEFFTRLCFHQQVDCALTYGLE
jgi:homoserine kinase type II